MSNAFEKEQSWRHHTFWFQNKSERYSDYNSMVLALSMCAQLHLILFDPMDCSSSDFSVHGDFLGKNIGVGRHFLTNPGIESASPPLAGGFFFLTTEPLGKPHWHKDPYVIKQNRKESPEINPWIYSQVIFYKGVKHTQYGKDRLFNKYYGENCLSTCRRIKLLFYIIHKNQLKKSKRLKYKTATVKFLKWKHRAKALWYWSQNWFLRCDMSKKSKTDKWDCTKVNNQQKLKKKIILWNWRNYLKTTYIR